MSNFDNFDIDQMSSKFAQIQFFVSYFHYKKISILGSLDNAENCQKTTFFGTPNNNNEEANDDNDDDNNHDTANDNNDDNEEEQQIVYNTCHK